MITKKQIILSLLPALLWIGILFYFNQEKKKEIHIPLQKTEQNLDGMVLMDRYCFACHHPGMGGGPSGRTGPPMFRVREHYFRDGMGRDEFVEPIIAYVQHPDQDKSKMPGAIRNFGLMPPLSIDQRDLAIIVNYIYDHDLSSQEWISEWREFKKTD
jgi:mono/diheme cytochrome c family protein